MRRHIRKHGILRQGHISAWRLIFATSGIKSRIYGWTKILVSKGRQNREQCEIFEREGLKWCLDICAGEEVELKGMVEWTGKKNIVKRCEMSLSYSSLTLDSLHFPCSSHLFPKCNTWLFQSFGQDIPFPGKFSFLETLLKPSPTTPAKKIPPPQRNLWLYNYLLYPFFHMIYIFFTHFYSILPFKRLIYSSNCFSH